MPLLFQDSYNIPKTPSIDDSITVSMGSIDDLIASFEQEEIPIIANTSEQEVSYDLANHQNRRYAALPLQAVLPAHANPKVEAYTLRSEGGIKVTIRNQRESRTGSQGIVVSYEFPVVAGGKSESHAKIERAIGKIYEPAMQALRDAMSENED